MIRQPECLDCQHGQKHPFRRDGVLDPEWLATAYLKHIGEPEPQNASDDGFWAWECSRELSQSWPDQCLQFVQWCLRDLTGPHQASVVAAGPLEDLIALHGGAVIDRIEALARQSDRYRYLLSGVWAQGKRMARFGPELSARSKTDHRWMTAACFPLSISNWSLPIGTRFA
ncbi:MAG: DUF6869 domain-containing protein [bacterium]